jgi:hypothetical protein
MVVLRGKEGTRTVTILVTAASVTSLYTRVSDIVMLAPRHGQALQHAQNIHVPFIIITLYSVTICISPVIWILQFKNTKQ